MKRVFLTFCLIIRMLFSSAAQKKKPGYNPEYSPEVLNEKDFENAANVDKIHGFINWDFELKDITPLSLKSLALQAFDDRTIWTGKDKQPKGFHRING